MLLSLLESRASQGLKAVDFKFENILNLLSPKSIIEDIKLSRKEIAYLYSKYAKLDDENPEKEEIGEKLNNKFSYVEKYYNNTLSMLPLAIEDIKTKLLVNSQSNTKKIEDIKAGILELNENGVLKIIESKKEISKELIEFSSDNTELIEIFKKDYKEVSGKENKYIEDLVVRTFVPIKNIYENINYEEEINKYNSYLDFYKIAQEKFIKIAKPLIETIIGVKMFFDQYDVKIKKMQPKLLITNISNKILSKSQNLKKLDEYLLSVNGKNDTSNSIWFAIYPNLDLDSKENSNKKIFKTKSNSRNYKNNLEELSIIIKILSKYKIQTFFNFELNENMTFDTMSYVKIDQIEEKLKPVLEKDYSEYLIPCLPNFTIIPKIASSVMLDYKMEYSNNNVNYGCNLENVKFYIDGLYIASSYIAAGLTSAYQCSNYMKERFKNVIPDIPSVRFNIEAEDNYLKVKTTLPREISGYTTNLKNRINSNNFGFIFSSDIMQLNNEKITNITVYKARCLMKDNEGFYEPIFKTMASTYIERVIRYMTADFKVDKLNYFFSNTPNSQKSIWLKQDKYVNSIISVGDSIEHEIDTINNSFKLKLKFSGNEKNLTFEINKNE